MNECKSYPIIEELRWVDADGRERVIRPKPVHWVAVGMAAGV
jgi:hypothetical protein